MDINNVINLSILITTAENWSLFLWIIILKYLNIDYNGIQIRYTWSNSR
jgi:hypothetical protein